MTMGGIVLMGWPALFPAALGCGGNRRKGGRGMNIAVLGIDLGKNSCSVVGLDSSGKVVLRRRLSRDGVVMLASGCRAAWWRWRRAVGRTTWAAGCVGRAIRCG